MHAARAVARLFQCWPLLLLCGVVSGAALAADSEELARTRAALGEMNAKLAADVANLSAARDQSFELERELTELTAEQDRIAERIKQRQQRITALREEAANLEAGTSEARESLADSAVRHYSLSAQPLVKILLNHDEADAFARRLAYHNYLLRAYDRDLAEVNGRLGELEATSAALKLESSSLRRLRQRQADKLEQLIALRETHSALIADIESVMQDDRTRVDQLQRDEQRLLSLVERVATSPAQNKTLAFNSLRGKLDWPVAGRVAKAPGRAMRSGGARWAGVLINGKPGAEVRVIAAGEVVFADWFRNLGKLVIVDHGDGYLTLYGNNAEVLARPGDQVRAGDTIATVGTGSGDMPGGLYFELRESGEPLDPRGWFAKR